jgi:hypothetical protein
MPAPMRFALDARQSRRDAVIILTLSRTVLTTLSAPRFEYELRNPFESDRGFGNRGLDGDVGRLRER